MSDRDLLAGCVPQEDDDPEMTHAVMTAAELWMRQDECADAPHRGPQGPNEDVDQCSYCLSVSHVLRPVGETFGQHIPDCSLPERHYGYCQPGGNGHPRSEHERG